MPKKAREKFFFKILVFLVVHVAVVVAELVLHRTEKNIKIMFFNEHFVL